MEEVSAKKQYKQVGKALFIFAFVSASLQIVLSVILVLINRNYDLSYDNIISWVITFVPIYLVAFPISLLVFRKIPTYSFEKKKIGFANFVRYFIESISVMYIGNIVGTFISNILSQGQATNPLLGITAGNDYLKTLIIVIVAPIIEEIIFRKLLIDKTIQFGEKTAIVFSALSFGLFHMNLFQFFYAFGLGLVFAYIYVKTRDIKYSMIIHVIINFFGGIITPYLLSNINIDVLTNIEQLEQLSETELINTAVPIILFGIYVLILLIFSIIGIILLLVNRRKITFEQAEGEIKKGEKIKTTIGNVYYVLFMIICFAVIILSLFG